MKQTDNNETFYLYIDERTAKMLHTTDPKTTKFYKNPQTELLMTPSHQFHHQSHCQHIPIH